MIEPKVGIVLVNYNGAKFQNDCIRTVKSMTYQNFEIIVVDNASSDNSLEILKSEFPEVTIIKCTNNFGVAKGNNIGIKYALKNKCEYILLLNNDTELEPKLLEILVKKANKKVITVPKIYYYEAKNLLWYAGGKINWNKGIVKHLGDKEYDRGQYNKLREIEYSPTCCMLVHKDIFEKIGLMDEAYFMYYDDTDFCIRVLKNHYKILYVPKAYLWHKVSSSSGGKSSDISVYYSNRNRLYIMKKFNFNVISYIYTYTTRIIKMVFAMISNSNEKLIFNAIIDYKRNNMGIKK